MLTVKDIYHESLLVVLDSILDCPKLALRNQGIVYAAQINDGILLCCRCVSKHKGNPILLFIQVVNANHTRIDDTWQYGITLHCSVHKKHWFRYSNKGQIFSAFGVTQEDIDELMPYAELLTKVVCTESAAESELTSIVEAIGVVMSIAFNVDFSPFNY